MPCYRVTVTTREEITRRRVLSVEAADVDAARDICEEDRDEWLNGEDSLRVTIVEPETITDVDLSSLDYSF